MVLHTGPADCFACSTLQVLGSTGGCFKLVVVEIVLPLLFYICSFISMFVSRCGYLCLLYAYPYLLLALYSCCRHIEQVYTLPSIELLGPDIAVLLLLLSIVLVIPAWHAYASYLVSTKALTSCLFLC